MMDPKLKRKWVENLRSGKFTQTRRGFLQVGDANCCLGVLCITAGAKFEKKKYFILNGKTWTNNDYNSPLSEELGIPNKECHKLALNNDKGMSFKRLAYIIEKTKKY